MTPGHPSKVSLVNFHARAKAPRSSQEMQSQRKVKNLVNQKRAEKGINSASILLWGLFFLFIAIEFFIIRSSWIGWIFLPVFIIFNLVFLFVALYATFGGIRE